MTENIPCSFCNAPNTERVLIVTVNDKGICENCVYKCVGMIIETIKEQQQQILSIEKFNVIQQKSPVILP